VSEYSEATYPSARNVPVFHAVTGWTENATKEQRIAQMVSEIRSITPSERPAFLHVFIWNWGADMSIYPEVMKRLGPAYAAVRPDHLAALYRQDMQKRQLLVRAPQHMLALEGRPVQLNVTLHNVGGAAMDAKIRVSGSADDGQATPSSVTLQPGEPVDVAIAGTPAGDELGLLIQTSAGERRYSVPVRRIAASEIDAAALPQGTLRFVRRYEGETLAHNSGAVATDAGASNSAIWRADATTAKPGEVVFGPYAPLPAGKYVAIFRLKGGGSGVIGKVDTCVGGGAPITASREIRAEDVAEDQFRCRPLEFTHPGGAVETRVGWYGQGWIGVDWVALFRIEP
jgi:hypothetical protein